MQVSKSVDVHIFAVYLLKRKTMTARLRGFCFCRYRFRYIFRQSVYPHERFFVTQAKNGSGIAHIGAFLGQEEFFCFSAGLMARVCFVDIRRFFKPKQEIRVCYQTLSREPSDIAKLDDAEPSNAKPSNAESGNAKPNPATQSRVEQS